MQTREYLENYWLLFLDFIKSFRALKYYDIPLPLLANFYQFLDDNVKKQLNSPDFKRHLTNKSLPAVQTQPEFERWLGQLEKSPSKKPLHGKILLNFNYLRFTPNSYKYFDPQETVIFASWEKNNHLGIPVHCIKRYNPGVDKDIARFKDWANNLFKAVDDHVVFGNNFFYNTFMNRLPLMLEGLAAVNKYFDENPVACVIVGTTEDLIARILTLVAAMRGIPSICLQHGLLGGDEAYIPAFSTFVAVFGHYEKEWYQRMGLSSKRIAITGHPRFDDIFTQQHMPKTELQKTLDLNPAKKTVLLATQPNFTSLWNRLIEILAGKNHLQVVIKPHPLESRKVKGVSPIANYEKYAEKYQSVKLVTKRDFNLNDLLANSDVVVTNLSTASIEALLLQKPLLFLTDIHFPYFDSLGEFIFSDPDQLAEQIDSTDKISKLQKISKKARQEFMQYAYPQKLSGPLLLEVVKEITGK